ncbi:MAG: hypothetical protein RLP44_00700 [Aggregatilineales bacterium]
MSDTALPDDDELTTEERNALRTFLQRSEVRSSTMHRIVTAFISGAGLMILIPVFFKDVIDGIIEILINHAENLFPSAGANNGIALTVLLYALVAYPLLLSMIIPLYAVYLLLKDIVHFYFTVYMPGYSEDVLTPSLSINPITLPIDEAPNIKARIMRYQYKTEHMTYMLPFSEARRHAYFDLMLEQSIGEIVPKTRRLDVLREQQVIDDDIAPAELKEIERYNVALGILRAYDRTLVAEVANAEMTMVRNAMYIRRMLLRYIKALLMFIWTMATAFLMLPFLKNPDFPTFIVLSLGYTVWSLAVVWIMRVPVRWIYLHRHTGADMTHLDPQMTLLERHVIWYCRAAVVSALLGLILSVLIYI